MNAKDTLSLGALLLALMMSSAILVAAMSAVANRPTPPATPALSDVTDI